MYETDLRERLRWSGYSTVVKSPIILKNKHAININNNKDIVYWNTYQFI